MGIAAFVVRLGCSRLLIWETFFFRRADGMGLLVRRLFLAWRVNMTHETPGRKSTVLFGDVREYGVYRFYAVFNIL